MRTKKVSKATIVTFVLSALIFALAAYVLAGTVIAKKENRPVALFGLTLHIVMTDSMTPEIEVGDYLIARQADASEVQVGDDIVFVSPDPMMESKIIVHRVVRIDNVGGELRFVTKGVKPGANEDRYPVTEIIGIKVLNSAFLGKVYRMFATPYGLILFVLIVVCVVVAIKQCKKIVGYIKKPPAQSALEPPAAEENDAEHKSDKHE